MRVELDFDEALMWGLRAYARLVTKELGLTGQCSFVQAERPATTYLALDGRLPGFPDRDVALLWDEDSGWSAAVETHSGEDLVVLAHFGPDVLPAPRAVARWALGLFRGERCGTARPEAPHPAGEALVGRLALYAAEVRVPLPRNA